MEHAMRTVLALVSALAIAVVALPATAQQPAPAAAPAKVEPAKPAARSARRVARIKHHRFRHAARRRDSICSIVNGWRAFDNRYDRNGYFYTGRVCCCG